MARNSDAYAHEILRLAGINPGQTNFSAVDETADNSEYTYPTKEDALCLFKRFYVEQVPLNCARALDGNLIIDTVIRQAGTSSDNTSDTADMVTRQAGMRFDNTSKSAPAPVLEPIMVPSPEQLFDLVWGLVPDFLKAKIREWAASQMRGQIAQEITEYVKQALGLLPIPVPSFFINFAANLVIPPLVELIISQLANIESGRYELPALPPVVTTGKSRDINRELHRKILLRAGLPARHLPAHLLPSPDSGSADEGDEGDDFPCLGQPDRREAGVQIKQFYARDRFNGCKPLDLAQVVAAQIRVAKKSNPDAETLGQKVWQALRDNDLKDDEEKKDWATRDEFKVWARETPPNEYQIAQHLYDPVAYILQHDYNIPKPIVPAFTSMKVPQVTAYVINEAK